MGATARNETPKKWSGACKSIGVRVATAKANLLEATEARVSKASSGPSSFLAVLADTSAQPEAVASEGDAAVPPVATNAGFPGSETSMPARAHNKSALPVNEEQQQAAAVGRSANTPAQSLPQQTPSRESETTRKPEREAKTQSPAAASASRVPNLPALAVSPLPVIPQGTAAQAEAKTESPAVEPAGESASGTSNAQVESAGMQIADAAAAQDKQQDKRQASGVKSAGDAGAANAGAADQAADAGDEPQETAAGFATAKEFAAVANAIDNVVPAPIGALAGGGEAIELPGAAAQSGKPGDAVAPANADGVKDAGNTKAKQNDSATGAPAAPAHASAADSQAAQQPSGTASQPSADAPKPANAVSPQPQGIAGQAVAHTGTPAAGRAEVAPQPSRAGDPPIPAQTAEAAGASVVNTANLIQKMSESEMHLAVHSTEFGAISIRTSLSDQQMMAQISVDHGDLGKAIFAHVPAMEAKLGSELGVRALVAVNQSNMSFSGEAGSSPREQQRGLAAASAGIDGAPAFLESDDPGVPLAIWSSSSDRLDIQA